MYIYIYKLTALLYLYKLHVLNIYIYIYDIYVTSVTRLAFRPRVYLRQKLENKASHKQEGNLRGLNSTPTRYGKRRPFATHYVYTHTHCHGHPVYLGGQILRPFKQPRMVFSAEGVTCPRGESLRAHLTHTHTRTQKLDHHHREALFPPLLLYTERFYLGCNVSRNVPISPRNLPLYRPPPADLTTTVTHGWTVVILYIYIYI